MEEKRFDEWNKLKQAIHESHRMPTFNEGEIWWCAMGENIGVEINGKGSAFSRPVLIFKKMGRLGFIGIPLTSQPHEGSWYVPFTFQGKRSTAVLSQQGTFSASRLYNRMGSLSEADFNQVAIGFNRFFASARKNLPSNLTDGGCCG